MVMIIITSYIVIIMTGRTKLSKIVKNYRTFIIITLLYSHAPNNLVSFINVSSLPISAGKGQETSGRSTFDEGP